MPFSKTARALLAGWVGAGRTRLVNITKVGLLRLGGHVTERTVSRLDATANFLEVGRWLHSHGYAPEAQVERREQLWHLVAERVKSKQVLFLEFGVSSGSSIAYWSNLLRNPDSRLDGFDTFEGLPENWRYASPKGKFSTGGFVPLFEDPRIRLIKGLFADTLANYEPPVHDQLIVHMDADLYSSTTVALRFVRQLMSPGSFLIFDEFNDRHHELKAFDEFLSEAPMGFRLVAADKMRVHVAFERIT